MNSQSHLAVQGMQGLPLLSFMAARALVTIGSDVEDKAISFARATLRAPTWKY